MRKPLVVRAGERSAHRLGPSVRTWVTTLGLPLALGTAACSGGVAATKPAAATSMPVVSGDGSGVGDDGKPFDNDVSTLIGQPAPEWTAATWFNSAPLSVASLRGRVIFVRWFMGPTCPLCNASAPSLRRLDETYRARGLTVVGMYHHKDAGLLKPEAVAGYVRGHGYAFPVAIDADWVTLNRYWLTGHEHRKFTSVSFAIDKHGRVRHVHLGGRMAPDAPDFREVERVIGALLDEP